MPRTPKRRLIDRLGAGKSRLTSKTDVSASRFRKRYRELSPGELAYNDQIKDTAAQLEFLYNQIGNNREISLAQTYLEISAMLGVKALTGRTPQTADGKPRSDADLQKILRQAKRVRAN